MADFDSPWKEALSIYFPAFLAFFFADIHDDIDWSRGYELLNNELQKIAPKGSRGRRYVDLLVKVWRKNAQESWVLLHVEVQTSRDPTLMARLYGYNTRIAEGQRGTGAKGSRAKRITDSGMKIENPLRPGDSRNVR
jgi:hypothetical protein